MARFDVVAFDADDTLWHNERIYTRVQVQFEELLGDGRGLEEIKESLYRAELRNLPDFGYGVKGFALSMIETAIELSDGRISAHDIQRIIDMARGMLNAEVALLDNVADTIAGLSGTYPLMLVTKGDLQDQERKVGRSGLASFFRHIEIVSDKHRESYTALLRRHGIAPERFLMVGNSLRSDILPVLAIGAHAVYVPYELVWAHEAVDVPSADTPGFYQLERIGLLPALLESLER
jgi:putative hydrolase of the HAD superfamily